MSRFRDQTPRARRARSWCRGRGRRSRTRRAARRRLGAACTGATRAVARTDRCGAAQRRIRRERSRERAPHPSVAALNLAKRFEVDVSNREDVAAAYATLNAAPPARAPVATIFAGSAVALGVLLLVWLAVAIRRPSHPARPIPPLVTGAYFHGGTPARDEALEKYVVNELTDLVIETDADRGGSHDGAPRAKHVAELRNSSVIASRGRGLALAWRELIDTFDHWVDVRVRSKEFHTVEAEPRPPRAIRLRSVRGARSRPLPPVRRDGR